MAVIVAAAAIVLVLWGIELPLRLPGSPPSSELVLEEACHPGHLSSPLAVGRIRQQVGCFQRVHVNVIERTILLIPLLRVPGKERERENTPVHAVSVCGM